jgi:hypothetical protein
MTNRIGFYKPDPELAPANAAGCEIAIDTIEPLCFDEGHEET